MVLMAVSKSQERVRRMQKEQIKQCYQHSAMPTYARFDVDLVSGKGCIAYDSNGKKYIDFGSGIGVNSLGYSDEGWVQAICNQAKQIQHTSNLYYNDTTAKLTKLITELTNMDKVFLGNSGAEANECAIKLVRKYSFDKYGEDRYEIITLNNSFHGRTLTTLSATGQEVLHPKCFAPFVNGFKHCDMDIEQLSEKITDKTCAIMFELIQGEGGVYPLDKKVVKEVCELAGSKDILVIVDEVQTGIGRTGKFLACEHYDVIPDVVTLAKGLGGGLPIGACVCNQKTAGVLNAGSHGSTFGGNPVACAAALYVLETVAQNEFLAQVIEKGEYIKKKLADFDNVRAIRGAGLMLGVEFNGKQSKDIAVQCLEKGLIVLTAKSAVRMLPPLNITYDEIDQGLNILKSVAKENA